MAISCDYRGDCELGHRRRADELSLENLQLRPVQCVAEGSLDLSLPRCSERTYALAEQILGNNVYAVEVDDRRM